MIEHHCDCLLPAQPTRFARAFVLFLCISVPLAGCHLLVRSVSCAKVSGASEVIVRDPSAGGISRSGRVIKDLKSLGALVAFTNLRRQVWQPLVYTMPSPIATATFYKGTATLGTIGRGSNFFFVSTSGRKGIRAASRSKLREFDRLIGDSR